MTSLGQRKKGERSLNLVMVSHVGGTEPVKGTKVTADGSRKTHYLSDPSFYIRFILFEMGLHFKVSWVLEPSANIINHFAKIVGLFNVSQTALIYNLFMQIFRIPFIPITTCV